MFATIEYAVSKGVVVVAAVGNGTPVQGTGYDFADFLLGLPQQTALQYSPLTYNFRDSSWDAFIQDDWRWRGNLTLQFGLRYDYASPYIERNHNSPRQLNQESSASPCQGELPTWPIPSCNLNATTCARVWRECLRTSPLAGASTHTQTVASDGLGRGCPTMGRKFADLR